MSKPSFHEEYEARTAIRTASDRNFGLVMAGFWTLIAVQPLLHHHTIRRWALVVSVAFAIVALAAPRSLKPLNAVWTKLGLLMGHVLGAIGISIMFFLVFAPFAVLFRVLGKDLLHLRAKGNTYWIPKSPLGTAPASMKDQF
jgi:hypothetical protein